MTRPIDTSNGRARFDLHMHSTYSDGSFTPRELIAQARAAGLAGIAITDHDCLRQLSSIRDAARDEGYPVLAGTEISTQDPNTGRKVHILAYGLSATRDGAGPVERLTSTTLAARTAASCEQARIIQNAIGAADNVEDQLLGQNGAAAFYIDKGFSLERALETAGPSTALYKQHIMEALTHLPRRDSAYERIYRSLFKGGGIAAMDIPYPSAIDAVRAVREQDGVPVLAHADQMNSWDIVPTLARAGLLGIEVHHPDHDAAAVTRARQVATDFGLIATGGSDYHGRYGMPDSIGVRAIGADEAGEHVLDLFEVETKLI